MKATYSYIAASMKPIIFIMGVAGSGKTTIGKLLSAQIDIPFFDADDFHSQANKAKMKKGEPLTDEDRLPWLTTLNAWAVKQSQINGAIIACSALKENYRTILTLKILNPVWIFLKGSFELIHERMKKRKEHFMPPSLLQSQFEILEMPQNAFIVDIHLAPHAIVKAIIHHFKLNNLTF